MDTDKKPTKAAKTRERGVYKRGDVWWGDFTWPDRSRRAPGTKAKRYRRPLSTNKRKAAEALDAILVKLRSGDLSPISDPAPPPESPPAEKTLAEMAEVYLRDHAEHKRDPGYYRRCLAPWLAIFKDRPLSTITTHEIERTYNGFLAGVSHSTANSRLMILSGLFSKAIRWGFASVHPIRGKITKSNPDNLVRRYLAPEEQLALADAASAVFRPMLLVALNTGVRVPGELAGLTWADVDLDRGILHVRHTKTHRSRAVPLNATAKETLKSVPRRLRDERVFHQPDAPPSRRRPERGPRPGGPVTKTWFRNEFLRTVERANATLTKDGLNGIEGVSPYVTRKTFATTYMNLGGEIEALSRILGHTNVNTTRRYIAWTDRDLAPSVDRMDTLWSEKKEHRRVKQGA